MSAADLDTFKSNNAIQSEKIRRMVTNKWLFNLYLIRSLPMGFLAGLRVAEFTPHKCSITVPYNWLNQNPFRSTYFAVLAMAAEMSSGMIAMMHTRDARPSISMLVTSLEAEFIKKANVVTTFTCESGDEVFSTIEECIRTGQGQTIRCTATGRSDSGDIIARFVVTWSFKARSK